MTEKKNNDVSEQDRNGIVRIREFKVVGGIDCPVLALDIDSKTIHNTASELTPPYSATRSLLEDGT